MDALWEEVSDVLALLGLRWSGTKTRVVHLDEGFDFLGFHIQRRTKKGTTRKSVYTYPSKKALLSIMEKVRTLITRVQLDAVAAERSRAAAVSAFRRSRSASTNSRAAPSAVSR
ncbi:hypothetical protein [Nonomuraea aurantiaca]|uniref:hypothetical protein n=1 Tax=Nonomuraea aurantiaca TaxID=2878562 RepID=UPI001CD9C306|nr:hypothetical protein [Nonomuraea aurantiaca]MCA2227801.1 hypothetical protein [Nonomuraea aurantiaca]